MVETTSRLGRISHWYVPVSLVKIIKVLCKDFGLAMSGTTPSSSPATIWNSDVFGELVSGNVSSILLTSFWCFLFYFRFKFLLFDLFS